jgi:hypothetical protein
MTKFIREQMTGADSERLSSGSGSAFSSYRRWPRQLAVPTCTLTAHGGLQLTVPAIVVAPRVGDSLWVTTLTSRSAISKGSEVAAGA